MIYPDLPSKLLVPLEVIREQLRIDPRYLDNAACPYDPKTKSLLKLLAVSAQQTQQREGTFLGRTGSKEEILASEVQSAYMDLIDFSSEIGDADISEKMSYFRTRASLLEKLVSLIEKASTLADINSFQDRVIDIMEEMLTPDQREEFLNRLSLNTPTP